jgi:hypothetical protein
MLEKYWLTPPITRCLRPTRPSHTETIARKTPIPRLKVRKTWGIGVEQNIFPLRTTRKYPREKAVVVERPADGRRK